MAISIGKTVAAGALLAGTLPAQAIDLSFQGVFSRDDDVQFIDFTIGQISTVTLRTYSYAGGINAAGVVIPRGGFDPVIALFHATGEIIDAGNNSLGVPEDPFTHQRFDALFSLELGAGDYRVAMTQYDNSAVGPTVDDVFTRRGDGNFTPTLTYCEAGQFCDVSGVHPWNQRTGAWAIDILNVQSAALVPAPVPEPGVATSLLAGFVVTLAVLRRRIAGRP